ncbi:hypothetical protein DVR09_02495 [Erythrobacter aureus]|uniref:Uncharacterized protein n=2 Tax=Erythrobacter aureus TaxID=2182384 RepID=A0A345YBP6_9SPHN|nr:hypothetical protein DVR09_02495 [Erythrobacter aureus]
MMDELAAIDERISYHEEQFALAVRLGVAHAGEDEFIQLWRRVHDQFTRNLPKVRAAIRSGDEDYRQINRILPMTKRQIREVRADIAAADRAEKIGKKCARERLGVTR